MYQDYTNTANWQITNGMTVFATTGEKVGTVHNFDLQAGYLDVHKGWLFTKDFYVPFTAVDTVTEEGVVLRLTKDEIEQPQYAQPPVIQNSAQGEIGDATGIPPAQTTADPTAINEWDRTDEPARPGSGW
jgi:hypothetical protein